MIRTHTRVITIALCILVTWSAASSLSAQCFDITPDSVRSLVGESVAIPFLIRIPSSTGASVAIAARVRVGNYTLAYTSGIRGLNVAPDSTRIDLVEPGVFTLRFSVRAQGDSIASIALECLALAGSDTVCVVTMDSVLVDGASCSADSVTLFSSSLDHGGTYIKPLSVSSPVPLPCEQCSGVRWVVGSDKADTVRVDIIDMIGRSIDTFRTDIAVGMNTVRYDHRKTQVYNGLYAAVFRSSTGTVVRWFILAD